MKLIGRILLAIVGVVFLLTFGTVMYISLTQPDVSAAPEIAIEPTMDRIARGEYLVKHVAACLDCHSHAEENRFATPLVPGTEGMGGRAFTEESGFPGTLYAPNITPAALRNWTDGELLRALTVGVNRDDEAIFPSMPWGVYRHFARADLYAIIAYLRSMEAKPNAVPPSELKFPMNIIVRMMPSDVTLRESRPDTAETVAYGEYMAQGAGCAYCHTQSDKGAPVPGTEFGGGQGFGLPHGVVYSANITPDVETGIGSWTEAQWLERFYRYRDGQNTPVIEAGEFQTVMPWTHYAGMTDRDLLAIFAYLQTVAPIRNTVERFVPHN